MQLRVKLTMMSLIKVESLILTAVITVMYFIKAKKNIEDKIETDIVVD